MTLEINVQFAQLANEVLNDRRDLVELIRQDSTNTWTLIGDPDNLRDDDDDAMEELADDIQLALTEAGIPASAINFYL